MNGIEATRRIRQAYPKCGSSIPVRDDQDTAVPRCRCRDVSDEGGSSGALHEALLAVATGSDLMSVERKPSPIQAQIGKNTCRDDVSDQQGDSSGIVLTEERIRVPMDCGNRGTILNALEVR